MSPAEKGIREEAIRNTYEKMLKRHPKQKILLDLFLKEKLEALENNV